MQQAQSSWLFVFATKLLALLLIFGGFPVFLTLVVKNYNQKAEGIIQKRGSLEGVQNEIIDEVKVLRQEDARALQDINQYILGDWKSSVDQDYKIRFESNNTFTEFRGNVRVGYGLWRATVTHKKESPVPSAQNTEPALSFVDDTSTYHILRYQFESGKKSAPILHEISLLNASELKIVDSSNVLHDFVR